MNVSPLLVPTLLIAAVLALSGVLKLAETQATRDAFLSLRLPAWLAASPVPVVLPYAELTLAGALTVSGGRAGLVCAATALAVFAGYLAVVVRALRFDDPVTCACFGRLGLGQVSRLTLARNLLLVVLGALGVARAATGRSPIVQLARLDAIEWVWLSMVVASVAVAALVVLPGAAPWTTPELGPADDYVRQPTPFGMLLQPDGTPKSLRDLSRNGAVLLVFLSYGCAPCMRVIEQLPAFDAAHPEVSTAAVFHDGQRDQVAQLSVRVLLDPGNSVAGMFGSGSPSAVLLGADGMLAGGPVTGERAVADFLADISGELAGSREAVA